MSLLAEIWNQYGGAGIRRLIVVIAFIGIPMGVWWSAMPMVNSLPMSEDIRWLLTLSIVATLAFGGAAGVMVWRDLDKEP